MNCYRTSNNKYFTAPPRMADARHFTEYGENVKLNGSLQQEFEADNSYEYRMNLVHNAEKVMDVNNKKAFLLNGVTECKTPFAQGTMLPEAQKQVCNTRTCKVVTNDATGLGLGRQYSETPNGLLNAFTYFNYFNPKETTWRKPTGAEWSAALEAAAVASSIKYLFFLTGYLN